jgi:flavin reductase (DIM6/NTAB) family NADH-FMN oxidoreductase RutF
VTATHANQRGGLIATFVNHASIVPTAPRMLVGIAKQHHTWEMIEASRAFTLHLLDESCIDLVWHFGLQSGHMVDKFANRIDSQMPGVLAWLNCRVEASYDTGDRTLYLAEVYDGRREKKTQPLTMRRLLQLAPPGHLAELRTSLERDAAVDQVAIQAWRDAHGCSA